VNVPDLTNRIINETTFADAIAFLPSHLPDMKKAILPLTKDKKKWKIEILEQDLDTYYVKFEDRLAVSVKKRYMEHFMRNIFGSRAPVIQHIMEVDLSLSLSEAVEDTIKDEMKRLKRVLKGLPRRNPYRQSVVNFAAFKQYLGPNLQDITGAEVLINLNQYDQDVDNLLTAVKREYNDDLGQLQLLIQAMEQSRPVGQFPIFDRYTTFMGATLRRPDPDVELEYQVGVFMTQVPFESVTASDDEFLEELDDALVKTSGMKAYPRGKNFTGGFFVSLADEIMDAEEEEEPAAPPEEEDEDGDGEESP